MTALQKINQGTAPAGSDGDTVRSAFSKVNSNVDVLNTQAALTSSAVITAAQALTNAYVGKRVNINLTSAGTINMPAASTCAADQVTLLRNIGTTVVTLAIATGSGDTVALSKLNPGESALIDTDGVHAWNVLMRGRTNSDNEVVNGTITINNDSAINGKLTVNGNEVVTGSISVTGALTSSGTITAKTFSVGSGGVAGNVYGYNSSGVAAYSIGVGTLSGQSDSVGISTVTTTGVLSLGTNTTERVRIDEGGRVYINGTSGSSFPAPARLNISFTGGTGSSGSEYGVSFRPNFDNTFPLVFGNAANSIIGSIQCSASATTYNTGSDYRLKSNYRPIKDAADILGRIIFYEGEFIAEPGKLRHYVIAHELQDVVDYAVTGKKDEFDEKNMPVFQGVDYSKLIPLIGAALQDALSRISVLEGKCS
ncbi:TPA: hypothetical protein QDB24_002272 [Burkholderia vietnamiensis]|uniref:hypothetical protein n=1 Tax=Burkholderia vietnamiensis TaxID=60552 RepID=UPI001B9A7152|nr:hypothetical protein [Burkholderia vietnamiensis]MBR7910052.1 hypothetical protein [Burkholderia vietnamiensis]HDR9274208.1 hypothetical protein [Burkholderia vietnamiensis]